MSDFNQIFFLDFSFLFILKMFPVSNFFDSAFIGSRYDTDGRISRSW